LFFQTEEFEMTLNSYKRLVGLFPTYAEMEKALHSLNNASFPMQQVSIISRTKDSEESIRSVEVSSTAVDYVDSNRENKAEDGATTGAVAGATLGGLTGLLVGLGTLAIPGVGPILLAGQVATAIATTVAGSAIGAATGGILGALIGLGIPEEHARAYNDRINSGQHLVIVDGDNTEIAQAEDILRSHGAQELRTFDTPVPTVASGNRL
jgi:uncharacterized membrane protein